MQILVQVLTSSNSSLRDKIAHDPKLKESDLKVSESKRIGRQQGWTKLHSTLPGRHGAINVQWVGSSRMLLCRVITKEGGQPSLIIGDFIDYLLDRFQKKIEAINIIPR